MNWLMRDGRSTNKGGDCVSLNSSRKSEIRKFLEEYSEMEVWMLDSLF